MIRVYQALMFIGFTMHASYIYVNVLDIIGFITRNIKVYKTNDSFDTVSNQIVKENNKIVVNHTIPRKRQAS